MKRNLVAILAHSGAQSAIFRHWPYWEKSGADLLCVGRANTPLVWPSEAWGGKNRVYDSGIESGAKGDNHLLRLMDVISLFLRDPMYAQHQSLCMIEYDGIFLRELEAPKMYGLHMFLSGRNAPTEDGFHSHNFYHSPWMMDRETAQVVFDRGARLLKAHLYERGFIDRWLGLMVELYGIPVIQTKTYSQNSLDRPLFMEDARQHVKAGAWYVHGIKTAEQLQQLIAP